MKDLKFWCAFDFTSDPGNISSRCDYNSRIVCKVVQISTSGCHTVRTTYDPRSVESLEEKRKYLKPIFHYTILNDHTAVNLKEAFCPDTERRNTHNLRRTETDLAQPLPKKEFVV